MRARYGMPFVSSGYNQFSTFVIALLCAISCYNWLGSYKIILCHDIDIYWENTCTLHSGCCLTHISLGGFLWDPKGLVFPTCCSRSLRVISVLGLLPSCIWLVAHACSYANNKAIIAACCLDKCVVMGGGCLQKGLGVFYCGVKWNTYVKVTTCHILYLGHIFWVFVDYTNKLNYFE